MFVGNVCPSVRPSTVSGMGGGGDEVAQRNYFLSMSLRSGSLRKKAPNTVCKYVCMSSACAYACMYVCCLCNELRGEAIAGGSRLYSDATGVGRSGSHKEQQTHSGDGTS